MRVNTRDVEARVDGAESDGSGVAAPAGKRRGATGSRGRSKKTGRRRKILRRVACVFLALGLVATPPLLSALDRVKEMANRSNCK